MKVQWECEFRAKLKSDPSIDESLSDEPLLLFNCLNPRDAIYGGRTEVFKLHFKPGRGEKIRYIDFCSLYPFVNWRGKYPLRHPKQILVGQVQCDTIDLNDVEGLIKCQILPPQKLKIPVLPAKINSKLIFPLCRMCAEQQNINKCSHNEQERALVGTWVSCEVKMALKHGYKILSKIEIWTYETTQYDPTTKTGGLFTNYMKTFLKIKQESSGWPPDCDTQEKKDAYVEMYEKTQDIKLDYDKILVNPSYRSLAKLCANSLWGKLCQREERIQNTVIREPHDLYQMLISPAITVNDICVVSEAVCVQWKINHEEDQNVSKDVCVLAGAYTTTSARLMLFNELIQLQDEILYCDTDSLIYVEKDGGESKYRPNIGPAVGQLTDEILEYGPDAYISEYVCVGPKSYALKIVTPSKNTEIEVCKCKGFRLNLKNSSILNFDSYKKIVFGEMADEEIINTTDTKIRRKKGFVLTSELEKKRFQFTFSKRACIDEVGDTLPFGYKN